MGKKIFITGGDGFIAKSLREAYNQKYDVTSLNRKGLELTDSSAVKEYLTKKQFDIIIHTANYDAAPEFTTKDKTKVLEQNLNMYFNIARCNKDFGKMIFFGSGAEFGRQNWIPKMNENYFDEHVPQDQYGYSKYLMTKYALLSDNIYNLRIFGLFGKYDDWRYRFIPNICCKAALGLPIVIKQNAKFDHLYIDDLTKITNWLINNKPKEKVYNTCSGDVYEYKTLAQKVIDIAGKDLNIIVQKSGIKHEYSGDNLRLRNEFKNLSFTKIDDAIKDLYMWYNNNKSIIKQEFFTY